MDHLTAVGWQKNKRAPPAGVNAAGKELELLPDFGLEDQKSRGSGSQEPATLTCPVQQLWNIWLLPPITVGQHLELHFASVDVFTPS